MATIELHDDVPGTEILVDGKEENQSTIYPVLSSIIGVVLTKDIQSATT